METGVLSLSEGKEWEINCTHIGQVPSVRDMMHTQVEVHDNVLLLDVFSIKIFAKIDLTFRTLLPPFLVTVRSNTYHGMLGVIVIPSVGRPQLRVLAL